MAPTQIYILGSDDPEMVQIEALLRQSGRTVVYAQLPDGSRPMPSQVYSKEVTEATAGLLKEVDPYEQTVCIECAPIGKDPVIIDHHRPGDPGYNGEDIFASSSLGQVISHLAKENLLSGFDYDPCYCDHCCGLNKIKHGEIFFDSRVGYVVGGVAIFSDFSIGAYLIPSMIAAVGAADHNLPKAYSVPGVSREDVLKYRIKVLSDRLGKDTKTIEEEIDSAIKSVEESTACMFAGQAVCDFRGTHIEHLPDVASYCGIAYITEVDDRDGRRKVVIGGKTTPEQVQYFLDVYVPENGLVESYGVPARGFAGAYFPTDSRC